VARYWATGSQDTPQEIADVVHQMRLLGFNAAQIELYERQSKPDHLEVFEENWEATKWFLEVDDLFKTEQGILIGLDVTAIRDDAEMRGRTVDPEEYAKLREIGRHAAAIFNSRGK